MYSMCTWILFFALLLTFCSVDDFHPFSKNMHMFQFNCSISIYPCIIALWIAVTEIIVAFIWTETQIHVQKNFVHKSIVLRHPTVIVYGNWFICEHSFFVISQSWNAQFQHSYAKYSIFLFFSFNVENKNCLNFYFLFLFCHTFKVFINYQDLFTSFEYFMTR